MAITSSHRPSRIRRAGSLLLGGVIAGSGILSFWERSTADPVDAVPTVPVQRINLSATVIENGEVDSSEKTLIQAELKAVRFRNSGASIASSGASVIIELVPEGTTVEAGQVICRLDSSEYEEMVRQQQITLEETLAQYNSARLTVETLEIQLLEYQNGLLVEQRQKLLGQLSMAEANLQRQQDRVLWSKRMMEIGYVTRSQHTAELNTLLQTELALSQARLALNNLDKHVAPKRIIELQSQIDGAMSRLRVSEARVKSDREQLVEYSKQVENCTIRAPHDGFLIYVNDNDDSPVEFGAAVRQRQNLFYLPDLSQMEVRAELHESVVTSVKPGMSARVHIEALPGIQLEGEVTQVAPLPKSPRSRREPDEIKNYVGRIKLHTVPEGLMPGMTAQVEILTNWKPDALVIPPQALGIEDDTYFCYVRGERGIERREVALGATHPQMIEIVDGLSEGEHVVTDFDSNLPY